MTKDEVAILDDHIPYRLTNIDGMRWACELLHPGPTKEQILLTFAGRKVVSGTPRCITNPLIETGAISCRVMLEFLGIGLDRNGALVEVAVRKPDDITIERFGVPRVVLADLNAYAGSERDAVHRACIATIHMANKAVAHFTIAPIDRLGFERLLLCGKTIVDLVEQHLYAKIEKEMPEFRIWPEVTPLSSAGI